VFLRSHLFDGTGGYVELNNWSQTSSFEIDPGRKFLGAKSSQDIKTSRRKTPEESFQKVFRTKVTEAPSHAEALHSPQQQQLMRGVW
jgi:hypothetical protein